MNKVILMGRLGRDPELRYTESGQPVANFSIATNERWKDKDGESQERTEWHRLVVWGKQAEVCEKYLTKGRQVLVEGRLQTREWADKNGEAKKTTEIVVTHVEFIGGGRSEEREGDEPAERGPRTGGTDPKTGFGGNDDIPF